MPTCARASQVAAASLVFFVLVDHVYGTSWHGVEMSGLVHSIICAGFTLWSIGVDYSNGVDWPNQCETSPSLPSLLLPMVCSGYAVFDIIVGLRSNRIDYFLHGVGLLALMGTVCAYNQSQQIVYGLLMEWSTIFLNLRALKKNWIDVVFVVLFVLMRLIVIPVMWHRWNGRYYSTPAAERCVSEGLFWVINIGTGFFTLLNAYWGQIIVRRLAAKLQGGGTLRGEWTPEPGQKRNVNANPKPFTHAHDD